MNSISDRANIARYLNDQDIGFRFTMQSLVDANVVKTINSSRRMRELREVAWEIPWDKNGYVLNAKGAMPEDEEWKEGRKGVSATTRREVFEASGRKCVICGTTATEKRLTIGHIVPVALGGTNERSNLQAECSDCNEQWRDRVYDKGKRLAELEVKHKDVLNIINDKTPEDITTIIELLQLKKVEYLQGENV